MKSNYLIPVLLIISILFLMPVTRGYAWSGDPVEKLRIMHDRELYLDGDTVWIKVIDTDPESGRILNLSSTVYVELLGRGEQLVERTKIGLNKAIGNGWITIPEGLLSGNYYLRAYTSWMKNSGPDGYAYSMISVVNPSRPLYHSRNPIALDTTNGSRFDSSQPSGTQSPETKLALHLEMEKFQYNRRDTVAVSIGINDLNGRPEECHLSASVYLMDTSAVYNGWNPQRINVQGSEVAQDPSVMHFPELSGSAVSGIVFRRNTGQPASGVLVTCTSLGSASQFQVFRTGDDGRFRFIPRMNSDYIDLVFNVPDQETATEILLDDPYSGQFLELSLPTLRLNKGQVSYVERLSINKQVTGNYNSPEDPPVGPAKGGAAFFYGEPSETVDLENYIRLPVMEEIFRELVKTVILYRTGGDLKFGVIDAVTNGIIGENPLFLLDGVPLYRHQKILEIDPSLLRFIHVADSRYFVGEMEFDGIIDFRSANGNYSDFELPSSAVRFRFQGCTRQHQDHLTGEYSIPGTDARDRQPDFRTLLYWNPELSADADGFAKVSFVTPDVPGTYQVVVEGISLQGHSGKVRLKFEVD